MSTSKIGRERTSSRERHYVVLTRHDPEGVFIAPMYVWAESPEQAAERRFSWQDPESQADTLRLLVFNQTHAWLFRPKSEAIRMVVAR